MVSALPSGGAAVAASPVPRSVRLPAWLEVAKPRLIPLLLATTLGGMALSGDWPVPGGTIVCTLVGGALASAAAGVLNCLWEQELDGRMVRTSRRALPSGRLAERQAFALAIGLTGASLALLLLGANALAASLALLGLCSYVLLYTALLKPRTPQNIVIGGVAGAIPPLVGVAAASDDARGCRRAARLGTPAWQTRARDPAGRAGGRVRRRDPRGGRRVPQRAARPDRRSADMAAARRGPPTGRQLRLDRVRQRQRRASLRSAAHGARP